MGKGAVYLPLSIGAFPVPSASQAFLLNQPASGFGVGRTISGRNVAQGWIVFQAFDVPAPGWNVTTIGMDGWTVQDPGQVGFTGTLFPDNGTGTAPDETSPIGPAVYFQSGDAFSSHWVDRPFNVTLLLDATGCGGVLMMTITGLPFIFPMLGYPRGRAESVTGPVLMPEHPPPFG